MSNLIRRMLNYKFLPEIPSPPAGKKMSFFGRFLSTSRVALLFSFMSQVRLFGFESGLNKRHWMSTFSLHRGTIMDLGITHVVTANTLIKALVHSRTVDVDMTSSEGRASVRHAQKVFGLAITLFQAIISVMSGMYGADINWFIGFMIVFQLFVSSIVVVYLDEYLEKGHGLGPAYSLLMTINTCATVVWDFLFGSASLFQLVSTLIIVFSAIVISFIHLPLSVKSAKNQQRGMSGLQPYKITLLQSSTMPLVLLSMGMSFLSSSLSGLKWFLSPSIMHMIEALIASLSDPFFAIVSFVFTPIACAAISVAWLRSSNSSPEDVARQFDQKGLVIDKHERPVQRDRVLAQIDVAALLGGLLVGLMAVTADLIGAIGSGAGILIAVMTITDYIQMYETAKKENRWSNTQGGEKQENFKDKKKKE